MSAPAAAPGAVWQGPVVPHTVYADDGTPIALPLRGLTPAAFDALLSAHPDPEGLALFAEDTFGPALIAACLLAVAEPVDPKVPGSGTRQRRYTEHEVAVWWQEWPPDAIDELFSLCLAQSAPGSVSWAVERLRVDDRFAAEMAYCGPNGIPHDVFLTWSRSSQDKAIAWQVASADRCPGCGVPAALMDDPSGARVRRRRCVHCELLAAATEEVPPEQRSGIHSHVQPYSTAERAQLAAGIDPDARPAATMRSSP